MDLVGVEPTSAQGNHTLSTRLFQPSVFVCRQDLDHQPASYPLKFHLCSEACTDYFRLNLHRLISGFGNTSSERCPVRLSDSRIKPVTYCTSVRQRERNCFRQLIFRSLRFRSQSTMLRVLTYHFVLPSNPNKPMVMRMSEEAYPGRWIPYSSCPLTDSAESDCKCNHTFWNRQISR